ncbi:MAG: hypothetical protein O9301_13860 [Leptospira sp.]|nr:hypothetical protein [Leptospira sp.]
MKQKLLSAIGILFFTVHCGKKINISMVTSTSMESGLPFEILNGNEWKAEKGAEFVKVHFYADEAFALSKVQIQSCAGSFKDRIAAYVNFDEVYGSTDVQTLNDQVVFEPVVQARSVTLNFQRNQDICLKGVKFFDEKGKAYKPISPELVSAKVTASETASPEVSYSPLNLFDSKYENAYASKKGGKGVVLNFEFEKTQSISKLRFWNGYQRSDVHCIKNGRVKEFTLTGDNGYSESVSLEDTMGSQEISLSKTFEGKSLKLTVDSLYPGYSESGFVLSELRFGHGSDWIVIDTLSKSKETAKSNFDFFQKASLAKVLNRGLTGTEVATIQTDEVVDTPSSTNTEDMPPSTEEELNPPTSSDWTIRLRSDGTFFLEGSTSRSDFDNGEESSSRFYGLGNYEVKTTSQGLITLRIFGFLRKQTFTNFLDYGGGDCNGCGRDCNLVKNPDPNQTEKIFQEVIQLESHGKKFYLLNKDKKNLDFSILELTLE